MKTAMISSESMRNSGTDDDSCDGDSLKASSGVFESRPKVTQNLMQNETKNCTPRSLTLYSGFDDLFGGPISGPMGQSVLERSPHTNGASEVSSSDVNEHDISSHLKGALAFGLPTKGNRTIKTFAERPRPFLKFKPSKKRKSAPEGGAGLTVYRPAARRKEPKKIERREVEKPNLDHLNEELQFGYRILADLIADSLKGCNAPFMETINLDPEFNKDYLQIINEPLWLPMIKEKLLGSKYESITGLFADLRLMLENAYRYFGPAHSFTKKGLRLEFVMEQKIALLPREIRDICSIEKTNGITPEEQKEIAQSRGAKKTIYGDVYFSYLLYRVRGFRQAREKDLKRQKMEYLRIAKLNKELEVLNWEEDLVASHLSQMKAMWELPQIGQFVYLSLPALNIGIIPQYELERGLILPEASLTMRMLMTSLVSSPVQRLKIAEKPYMPYRIWAHKLANKVFLWYRAYHKERKNSKKIYDQLGIEETFWKVCGEETPFKKFLFHEMTFYQRTWLVKSMCDFIGHNHKSVQDIIMEQPEEIQREEILGTDKENKEYIYFPQFISSDLRIYKRAIVYYDPEESDHSDDEKPLRQLYDQRIFSKDQVKAFKSLLKGIKRKQEKDYDWEKSGRKKKRRKKIKKCRSSKSSSAVINPPQPTELRSRPRNLRQRPRTRYSEEVMLPSEIFDSPVAEESSSDSREESEGPSSHEDYEPNLNRSKVRNIIKKKGRQKPTCHVCGKTFAAATGLNGHMSAHSKAKLSKGKESQSSREGTPRPKKGSTKESKMQIESQKEKQKENEPERVENNLEQNEPPETMEQNDFESKKGEVSTDSPSMRDSTEASKSIVRSDTDLKKEQKYISENKIKIDTNSLKQELHSHLSENVKPELDVKMEDRSIPGIKSEPSTKLKNEEQPENKKVVIKEEYLNSVEECSNCPEVNGIESESNDTTSSKSSLQQVVKMELDVAHSGEKIAQDQRSTASNICHKIFPCSNGEAAGVGDDRFTSNTEGKALYPHDKSCNKTESSPKQPMDVETPMESVISSSSTNNQNATNCSLAMDDTQSPDVNYTDLLNATAQDSPVKEVKSSFDTALTQPPNESSVSSIENEDTVSPPLKAEDLCQVQPDLSQFELIASTIDELRSLILQFGPLPSKPSKEEKESPSTPPEDTDQEVANEAKEEALPQDEVENKQKETKDEQEQEKEKEEVETETENKLDCEVQLHKALCALLVQLAPLDGKLKATHKQLRKKLWQEFSDLCKKDASYIDPDEEAWLSEPEPEPSPPPPEPKPSSSSSSSEEEYNEDGIRKRKLRKRKVKKLSTPIEDPVPSFAQLDEDSDAVTVSSRGRIRRIKKILNYDCLDFDKLAQQAEKEALEEKEEKKKKKRKKEEEEEEYEDEDEDEDEEGEFDSKKLQTAAENLKLPSTGVRRYVLSKTGQFVGYINNEGHFHSSSGEPKKYLVSKESYLPPTRPIKATREKRPSIIAPSTAGPNTSSSPFNSDPEKVPTILVAAQNNKGGLVYVKINGIQALHLSKLLSKTKGMPPRQVKLQRSDQTYTFTSDSKILTQNIPGFPDCDLTIPPLLPLTSPVPQSSTLPIKPIMSIVSSNSSDSPKGVSDPPSVTEKSLQQQSIPPNTLALAYQGIPGLHSRIASSGLRADIHKTQVTSCASLNASTQLVSATPSVVPSVTPFTYSKPTQSSASLAPVALHSKTSISPSLAPVVLQSKTPIAPSLTPVAFQSKPPISSSLAPVALQSKTPISPIIQQENSTTVSSTITPAVSSVISSQSLSGGQMQMLNKLSQQTGQRLVAIPNGKGGFNVTLIATNPDISRRPASISAAPTSVGSLRANSPAKSTLITYAPNSITSTHSPDKRPNFNLEQSSPLLSPTKLPIHSPSLQVPAPETPSNEITKAIIVQNSPLQIPSSQTITQMNNHDKLYHRKNSQADQSLSSSNQLVHLDNSGFIQQEQQQIVQLQHQPQPQQQQQRVLQIVQAGNRQIFQLVQPMIVSENSNPTMAVPASTISTLPQSSVQSTGYFVQPQPSINQKQGTMVQPSRIILQTSPQQSKYVQIAKPEQIIQQSLPSNQVVQQQVIIHQPQTQHIVFQQPSVFTKGGSTYSTIIQENSQNTIPSQSVMIQPSGHLNPTSQTVMVHQGSHLEARPPQQVVMHHNPPLDQTTTNAVLRQATELGTPPQSVIVQQASHTNPVIQRVVQQNAVSQSANPIFLTEQASIPNQIATPVTQHTVDLHHQPRVVAQPLTDPLATATQQITQTVSSSKAVLLQQALQAGTHVGQQVKSPQKTVSNVQQGRLIVLQTTDGQRVCYQSSDGKLSLLTQEQLQPLIKNGTIKITE